MRYISTGLGIPAVPHTLSQYRTQHSTDTSTYQHTLYQYRTRHSTGIFTYPHTLSQCHKGIQQGYYCSTTRVQNEPLRDYGHMIQGLGVTIEGLGPSV
eukprot:2464704-Rhodomonas_salina.1